MFRKRLIRLPEEYSCPIPLGAGKYSTVYRAYQQKLDRIVAIKEIRNKSYLKIQNIHTEAQTLGRLKIPCIPQIYDLKKIGKNILIIMEWVRGVPLDYFIEANSDTRFRQIIADRLITSLSLLHKQAVAHRDLKPENIILSPDGLVYLVDFGFATEVDRVVFSKDAIVGTPHYMAPELWSCGNNIDYKKCDLFALGRIIEQLLGVNLADNLKSIQDSDPEKRPADAVQFLEIWKNNFLPSNHQHELQNAVSLATSEYLACKYMETAKKFYAGNHIQKTYQVIAEVLEEMPDHAEALSMLQSLRHIKRPDRHLLFISGAAILFIIFVCAFELGRNVENNIGCSILPAELSLNKDNTLVHNNEPILSGLYPMKKESGSSLCEGALICIIPQYSGIILVDGEMQPRITERQKKIVLNLSQGDHSIELIDTASGKRVAETVKVLPFEIKKIKLHLNE